jgi:hypothetical protein
MMDWSGPLYIPVLKGKQGEYKALKQLDPSVRGKLLPLIDRTYAVRVGRRG